MDQLQIIRLKSSWNVQGPYDISSILNYTFSSSDGECNTEYDHSDSGGAATHTMQLIPPQTEDNSHISCQMWLSCQQDVRTIAIEIVSSARNIEFYDDKGGYCSTIRGNKLSGEQETVYKTNIVTERPLLSCNFKFLSLADKKQVCLKSVNVKLTHQSDEGPSYGGSINMTRVREMMSSMSQPVSDRVENLMQTVEQYQKNQSSVMDDLQQAALSRTLTSKDPMASQMTGLLSVLAKASSMHSETVQRSPQSRAIHHGGDVGSCVPDNSQVPSNSSTERTREDETQDSTSQVLEKLMSTLSMTGASGSSSELASNPDFYSAMQGMCRDLNRMKVQDGRTGRHGDGSGVERLTGTQDDGQEKESSQIPQEKYLSSANNSPLELRLLGYVASMEERLMGRLERKLQEVKDHMDVRLNRLEALLLEQSCANKGESARIDKDHVHLQEEDLD